MLYYFLAACIRHLTFQRYAFFKNENEDNTYFKVQNSQHLKITVEKLLVIELLSFSLQTWVFLSVRSFIPKHLPFENTKSISYNINSLGTTLMDFF